MSLHTGENFATLLTCIESAKQKMMKGRDRNTPCWCGSGIKYKKCHIDRVDQSKDNPWAAVDKNRKVFQHKKCWALDVGLGVCEGSVIKAHTISRGPNLSMIAKDGHVLHYSASVQNLEKSGGKLSVEKIGIKDASVFNGFCSRHDRTLFSCIENEAFTGRPDQCLAVAYRTMSRERHGKESASHLRETLRGADKGKSLSQQLQLQKILDLVDKGNEAAKREHAFTHDLLTKALVDNRPDILRSLVVECDGHLPFMCAGAWSPFTDLFGKELQEGGEDEVLEQIFISSFMGIPGDYICISWRHVDGAPGKIIADQVNNLLGDKKVLACLQIVMKHVENIFFNPDWFGALSGQQRSLMDALAATGVDFMGSVPDAALNLDLDFQLPVVVQSFIV